MARRNKRAELLQDLIISEFRNSANNSNYFQAKLGLDRMTTDVWIQAALAGRSPYKNKAQIEKALQVFLQRSEWGDGSKGQGQKIFEKEGKDYLIRDFLIKPGERLPARTSDDTKFQILIHGNQAGGDRWVTTNAVGSLDEALEQAAYFMMLYEDFSGFEFVVRTFDET